MRLTAYSRIGIIVLLAGLVGLCIRYYAGAALSNQYFAGYLIELSLSIDNVFVFVLLFEALKCDQSTQAKVLSFGIIGAVIFRLLFIFLGFSGLKHFAILTPIFGCILLIGAIKLCFKKSSLLESWLTHFKPKHIISLIVLVELTDLVCAVDSVPAILAVTTNPWIAVLSNVMAIAGLRSLYFALSDFKARLVYLDYALALILAFIGLKILGIKACELRPEVLLLGIGLVLGSAVCLSFIKGRTNQ